MSKTAFADFLYNKAMQFQVPQFIDTEDKIVGPLTLRQFIYIAVAFGIFALLYFTVQTWVALVLGVLILGIAGAFSFIKIEGRPLVDIALAAAGFFWKPQTYIWQPEHPAVQAPSTKHQAPSEGGFSLEKMLANMALKKQWIEEKPLTREQASTGETLHKKWETMQTGQTANPEKVIERKMDSRYMIFERRSGERRAARRVDYR